MNKMKNVISCIGFLSGLLMLLVVLSVVLAPNGEVYNIVEVEKKTSSFVKLPEDTIDVIILGDSETYSAFSPLQMWKEQGITSYVCGTHAQRLCDGFSILKTSLETQSPKMVVLETNCLFRYAGVKPEMTDRTMYEISKVLPVFKYHNRWKQLFTAVDAKEQKKLEREHIRKGFKLRTDVVPYTGDEWMEETDERKKFGERAEEYLNQIHEFCKKEGIELILVTTPAPHNWTYAKHNSVNDWASANGVAYLYMNFEHKEIGLDWLMDTRDAGDHLNYGGAKKVSAYFGKYLKENYELTDHREDEVYSSWNEDLKNSGMQF
jgi:hypothetical protein